jgi:hypothetical protein
VTLAILRRYSPTVAPSFAAAIEAPDDDGRGSGAQGQYAAAVVDLDLLTSGEAPRGGFPEDCLIGRLRAALWGERSGGFIVGIAPAVHTIATNAQEAQHWTKTGIDAVLQR